MKIVVDAMGGDHAPEAVVEGAVLAAREYGVGVILTGLSDRVEAELSKYEDRDELPIEVVHAEDVVEMHESPAKVLRGKKSHPLKSGFSWLKMNLPPRLSVPEIRGLSLLFPLLPCVPSRGLTALLLPSNYRR